MHELPQPAFDLDLIEKYGGEGPRYTSYPTAVNFGEDFGPDQYAHAVADSNSLPMPADLSVYVHVPFCASPCFYCACNRVITRSPVAGDRFLNTLGKELALVAPRFDRDRRLRQLHLGGGTPTFLTPDQIDRLMSMLRDHFSFVDDAELGLEVDPRTVDAAAIARLAEAGFNRISVGVQDLDAQVQAAINRVHDAATVGAVIKAAQDSGFSSISVDLIYGLPLQTAASFANTIERIVAMGPDRLSLFNYAHLPHLFKAQRQIRADQLPAAKDRLDIFRNSLARLLEAGYEFIGMDHFARPDDSLVKAKKDGSLVRNFQGYSTHGGLDMVSFGPSAISQVGDSFAQNHRGLDEWAIAVTESRLPVARGLTRNTDDCIRADVIESIMCRARVDYAALEQDYELAFKRYFSTELEQLAPLAADGLVVIDDHGLQVTDSGLLFLRAIARHFDAWLAPAGETRGRFSRIV